MSRIIVDHLAVPKFADYITWRGVTKSNDPSLDRFLGNKIHQFMYKLGHFVTYPMPVKEHEMGEFPRVINWLLYETVMLETEDISNSREKFFRNRKTGLLTIFS